MQNKEKNYLFLIAVHLVLGVLIYVVPFVSKIYGYAILFGGIYFVVKTRNRNNEVLFAAAYVVGSEVFLRMTGGNPNYEFSKYGVMLFLSMGMFYSGFSKNAIPYWIFLILLIPGVIIGTQTLNLTTVDIRKTIAFNISGPICLGFSALYCYNRKITIDALTNLLLVMGLPIISCTLYLILFTPDLREVITSTGSNNYTSGGFGPNQVATALGLGMFIFFSRVILASRTKLFLFINIILVLNITYRGLLTFSRGGMITGFVMILMLLFFTYVNSKYKGKVKLNYFIVLFIIIMSSIWVYTESQTGGLIGKRYANQDALGRVKESKFTGREKIAESEINAFLANPFFGIGVAKGTEYRLEQTGDVVASHNEITRMLAEHGSLGVVMLLILLFTPMILYLDNKQHIYMFCFLLFWLLTINHAAMRTAAPSFVYALSLLKVRFNNEEAIVHRE
jgi:hypothetical protein